MPDNNDEFYFDGFDNPTTTPIPDVVFDRLMPELSDGELRVLLYIMRRTFGFKKQSDNISIKQLVQGITTRNGKVLDHGTGASRASVVRALRGLTKKGIIVAQRNRSAAKGNEPTTYALRFRRHTPLDHTEPRGCVTQSQGLGSELDTQQTVKQQTENPSSIRGVSPKNEERNEEAEGSQSPLEAPLTESVHKPRRFPQLGKLQEAGREEEPSPAGSEPKLSSQVLPPGLTRQYLSAARNRSERQGNPQGLVSLASVLPQPPATKRTYSQERQVLVDVIADLAREFRDEATLTESVSRAYNLMGKAGIKDIGVFTAKIYEARSITKERYGSIKRGRMPYFFSVLEDVCGQRRKPAFKPDAPS
jgi:hypothetical protein